MTIGLLLHLAWTGLMQSRMIAVLLCAAVAGGVAFQIPNDANLSGYEREIVEKGIVVGNGDVRVRPGKTSRFDDGDALAVTLAGYDGVVGAVPALMLPGALGKDGNFKGALVIAVDSAAARVPFLVVRGSAVPTGDHHSMLVGTSLAKRLGVGVGDEVQLRVVFGGGPASISAEDDVGRYTMTIRGLAAGSFLGPESIIVDRSFLTSELGAPHAASMVIVHLADHDASRQVAARIQRDHPDLSAVAWSDDSPFLSSAMHGSAAIGLVSRAMVWLAVLVPVWALLYVHVLHGRRQIAVLGAIGLSRRELFAIHLMQAAIVGAIGAAIGCALGFALVSYFASHPIFHSTDFTIRPVVDATTFAVPAVMVFVTTLLAGVFPAWRAARVDPARILRGTT